METGNGKSLQDLVDETPDLVDYFYNETIAPHFRARTSLTAAFIPPDFTNWRDEQRAWRETAILFDQSHHMPELFLKGPDALRLLTRVGINSFADFTPDRAKQLVVCTPRGHIIGDCIVYCLGENDFELVSGMSVLNWVEYQAVTGGFDVSIERDAPTPYNPKGRRVRYRFQLDGPNAGKIFDEVTEGTTPEIPFFRTARVTISGSQVLVLRHGMAGHQGVELSGPYDELGTVRSAILAAGEKHGMVQGGTRSYFSTIFESGWIAYPLPGIFTGEELRGFREWLPAESWEGNTQLGGSFCSSDIEDYYVTPWNLGYDRFLKFDHDFIGRPALESMAGGPHRRRVTLAWNKEDVLRVMGSQFGSGPRYKSIEFPTAFYGFPHFDEVRGKDGRMAGLSCHCGYNGNEGVALSLAMLDEEHAVPGTEVVLTWGEPNGGSRKPHVERHEQVQIRATVGPVPYSKHVREVQRAAVGGLRRP
ncbi:MULTISPECIES: aminomethyltransferase family protein [Actinomadura]|jgi:glycine cleavage system aminomethyltransferase T|uniref:Aminomethyl transferase family protein n=1 Tax=Actinomadura geliboluensis TaxID=882440 RepID=A0A5S4HAV8_9ACTN|nr:aminomethyltransferase family protein [Actinomadura geliboluensis]TMR42363.1 aminomethyl transferase family protein [Actinomadura geliboluensis]